MIRHGSDLTGLFRRPDAVAAIVAGREVFGLLKRTIDLPADWMAVATDAEGNSALCRAGGVVHGGDVSELLLVRAVPIELTVTLDGLVTADRYRCQAEVNLRIAVRNEADDLASFRRTICGSARTVSSSTLRRFVEPALRAALVAFVSDREAAVLVEGHEIPEAAMACVDALRESCFRAALTVEGAVTVRFDSPTFVQVRAAREEASRRRAAQDARRELATALEEAQLQHQEHLEALLTRLQESADRSPGVGIGPLLRAFSPKERGELYETLFRAAQPQRLTKWIVVAAGEELLYYPADDPSGPARRIPLAKDIGPLRSVSVQRGPLGGPVLVIGGGCGVHVMAPDGSAPAATVTAPAKEGVRGGVNSATLVGDRILASHSELGLLCWLRTKPDRPDYILPSMTADATAVRGVRFVEGMVVFSVDDHIVRLPADSLAAEDATVYRGSTSTITSWCATADRLYAGNAEGEILQWALDEPGHPSVLHRGDGRAAESVSLLDSGGVERLVYCDTTLAVHARVIDDTFVCRYEAGGQTLRRAEVAPDLLVATTDLRDRLICWSPSAADRPARTIEVARLCGHSIQDVSLVPRS